MSSQSKDVSSSGTPDGIVAVMGSLPSLSLLVLMHAPRSGTYQTTQFPETQHQMAHG